MVEKANELGINISSERLKEILEKFRNIEPEPDEEMEWLEYFDKQIKNLSEQIKSLGSTEKEGKMSPEEKKKIEEDFVKKIENFTAGMIEYAIKLTIRIAKGVIKGVIAGIQAVTEGE